MYARRVSHDSPMTLAGSDDRLCLYNSEVDTTKYTKYTKRTGFMQTRVCTKSITLKPALATNRKERSAAKPQPNGRTQNHGRTESCGIETASLLAGPQEAGPYDPSNMILSCHDSVGLLRDKDCSQLANNLGYCSAEKRERTRSRINHFAVIGLPVAPAGLSLRSSRLCGLMGLGSSAGLRR